MSNIENQKSNEEKERYIKIEGKKIPVSEEVYRAFYQPIWTLHKRMLSNGCCACGNWRDCSGDCGTCRYRLAGKVFSLEKMVEDLGDSAEELASDYDVEAIVEKSLLLETLLDELQKLDPEGKRMCQLYMSGKSLRQIEKAMNLNHKTCQNHWNKLIEDLREKLKSYR